MSTSLLRRGHEGALWRRRAAGTAGWVMFLVVAAVATCAPVRDSWLRGVLLLLAGVGSILLVYANRPLSYLS